MPQLKDIAIFRISGNVVPPVKNSGPKVAILIFLSQKSPKLSQMVLQGQIYYLWHISIIYDHLEPF